MAGDYPNLSEESAKLLAMRIIVRSVLDWKISKYRQNGLPNFVRGKTMQAALTILCESDNDPNTDITSIGFYNLLTDSDRQRILIHAAQVAERSDPIKRGGFACLSMQGVV